MLYFYVFYKNMLFLISISWSLLREFNTEIFTFPLPRLPKSVCFVTYWFNMRPWRQNFTDENRSLHVLMVVNARCWVLEMYNGLWAHDLMPWFWRFSQKFAVFFTIFCRDLLLSLLLHNQEFLMHAIKGRPTVAGKCNSHSLSRHVSGSPCSCTLCE